MRTAETGARVVESDDFGGGYGLGDGFQSGTERGEAVEREQHGNVDEAASFSSVFARRNLSRGRFESEK